MEFPIQVYYVVKKLEDLSIFPKNLQSKHLTNFRK